MLNKKTNENVQKKLDRVEQKRQHRQDEEEKVQRIGSELIGQKQPSKITMGGITVKTSTTKSKTGFGSAIGEFMPMYDHKQEYQGEEDDIPV